MSGWIIIVSVILGLVILRLVAWIDAAHINNRALLKRVEDLEAGRK